MVTTAPAVTLVTVETLLDACSMGVSRKAMFGFAANEERASITNAPLSSRWHMFVLIAKSMSSAVLNVATAAR